MFFYRKPETALFFIDILFHLFYSELIIKYGGSGCTQAFTREVFFTMAFSDYKNISQVQKRYNIRYEEINFIAASGLVPPAGFAEEIKISREHIDVFSSEASRCEVIVFPLLREVWKNYRKIYSLWIQKSILCDDDLVGIPDYIIAAISPLGKTVLESPLIIVAEAKKNDFELGWGQCLAGLLAAQKINGDRDFPVHGIVTDGKFWEFGRLCEDIFTKNIQSYTVDDLSTLFGVLNFVFQSAEKKILKDRHISSEET